MALKEAFEVRPDSATRAMRPGDLLGALTGDAGLPKEAVGKINTYDTRTYVAIDKTVAAEALKRLREGKIKGKKFRVRPID